jgi:RNA polymerase-binding transcription factor DksA
LIKNVNKLRKEIMKSMKMNDFFDDLDSEDDEDLDTICMYLAFQLHNNMIDEEKLDKMKKLILQIKDTLDKIEKNTHIL